ncbi:hypothetical protein ABF78_15065, partial [Enterobacter asburiae]
LMMSLWDALRMNMMISYQELVRTFPKLNYWSDMYKLMIHVIIFANQTNNKVIYEKVNYGSSGCRSCFWLRSTIIFSKQRHNDYATASYDTSFLR